jgi:hypothetical protein
MALVTAAQANPLTRAPYSGVNAHNGFDFLSSNGDQLDYFVNMSPAITGYVFAFFTNFPDVLVDKYFGIADRANYAIATAATGFTMPQISTDGIQTGVYQPNVFPGKVSYGKELSIKFFDFTELYLTTLFQEWYGLVSPYDSETLNMSKQCYKRISFANYKLTYYGSVLIFTTDPTVTKVTNAMVCYDIWPTNLPTDILSQEISGNNLYTFNMNFKVNQVQPISRTYFPLIEGIFLNKLKEGEVIKDI